MSANLLLVGSYALSILSLLLVIRALNLPKQFSLRALFIAITFASALLGLTVRALK